MRMSICLALVLLAIAPTTFAQRWTSPTIPLETTDRWCRDVGAPPGSPPLPPNPYAVGTNEMPFCYVPSDVKPPELLPHPDPVYTGPGFWPASEPRVTLEVFVSTEGLPLRIVVGQGFGKEFDQEALDVVRTWRWQPATKNGQPVAVLAGPVPVRFRLQGTSAKPYIASPPSENGDRTQFLGVDRAKYPLTIFFGCEALGREEEGYRATCSATLIQHAGDRSLTLRCTGKNPGCSIASLGFYPARWVSQDREVEVLGRVNAGGSNNVGKVSDEWRAAEYSVENRVAPVYNPPNGCPLPEDVWMSLNEGWTGWHLLQLSALRSSDQSLWLEHPLNSKHCPGINEGKFDGVRTSFVLTLIKRTHEQVVLLATADGDFYKITILAPPAKVTHFSVVSVFPPGKYKEFYTGKQIRIRNPSIAVEASEHSIALYYFDKGQWKYLVISD